MASSLAGVCTVPRRPAFSSAARNKVRVPRRRWTTWATVTLCEYPCIITSSTVAGIEGLRTRLLFGQNWGGTVHFLLSKCNSALYRRDK
jgi:hypothetical protein